jgi:hypothetical protein
LLSPLRIGSVEVTLAFDVNQSSVCLAPGLMETSKTRKDLEHGCTTEVPRRAA